MFLQTNVLYKRTLTYGLKREPPSIGTTRLEIPFQLQWPLLMYLCMHFTLQFQPGFSVYRITLLSSQDFTACSLFYPALQCIVNLNNFDCLFLFRTAVIFVAYFKFVTLLHSTEIFIFYVKKLTCRCLKERICAWKKFPSPSLPCKFSGNSR